MKFNLKILIIVFGCYLLKIKKARTMSDFKNLLLIGINYRQ